MAKRKTIGEFAKEYLESQGMDSVAFGDSYLLHEIAEYAGIPHRSWQTERQILNALERSPLFEKYLFRGWGNRLYRMFVIKGSKGDRCLKKGFNTVMADV
ncbi:hypothetical protein EDD75_0419 [Thermodesulfitimonas autotrophica]|uniref:Uncharacterized protein n=1 Tax=Thermodesulfitimonas autotrophica TaxID=1894989 RepID=A0A3N5C0C1_9THEO|nr:hypothetical protein [Thermodesulfitimonas autotrophica]RPF49601.1 hypothetical protein EDD75_0419 [Thermodesulfitimonas autotrophica]